MGKNTSQIQWSEEEAVKVILLRIFGITQMLWRKL